MAVPLVGQLAFLNNNKSMLDAHNCYPYEGQWNDRVDRALSTGTPVAIEQDLAWYVEPATGKGRVVVSHTAKATGAEPELRDYFFQKVRPIVEAALKSDDRSKWPLIVLHFDFKDNSPALLHAVWDLLGTYEPWISTALKTADASHLEAIEAKPIFVVTEESDAQEAVFFNEVPVGARLRLFGSAHTGAIPGKTAAERSHAAATMTPEQLLSEKPTNYRRWWNNSWYEVEEGGQVNAEDWSAADAKRLSALVDHAHKQGFWIRFYVLDGFAPEEDKGYIKSYNFGSREAVLLRWQAAQKAGVDFIATDQYEDLGKFLKR